MLRYSLILLIALLTSCGARKVSVQKTDTIVKTDSSSVVKKEESVVTQNNIVVNTDTDEIEITPIDSTKPVIIGDKKYFNAKIRHKKVKTSVVDTTKKEEEKKEVQEVKVVKEKKEKGFNKKVDKKESFIASWWWLLILLLVLVFFYSYIKLKKKTISLW